MTRLVVSLLVLSTLALPSFSSTDKLLASVRPLMAQVFSELEPEAEIKGVVCTTTSINTRLGLWLTAAHCLQASPLFIEDHPTMVVYKSVQDDLAVLHTPDLQGVPALRMAVEPPTLGMPVHMMGFPLGFVDVQYFNGTVSSLDTAVPDYGHYIMFDMAVCGGNSGSAVVNSRDEVVSVMQIGPGRPCAPISGGATWPQMQAVAKYFGP